METPIAVTIPTAVKLSGMSRTALYGALKRQDIPARKAGRRTLISFADLQAYLASLPAYRVSLIVGWRTLWRFVIGHRKLVERSRQLFIGWRAALSKQRQEAADYYESGSVYHPITIARRSGMSTSAFHPKQTIAA